jgi:hypothetical protein
MLTAIPEVAAKRPSKDAADAQAARIVAAERGR